MQDSRMMAEVGFIEKVSGNRIATPFGPPRPGSTPTTMPSRIPTNIRPVFCRLRTWPKPAIRELSSSMRVSSIAQPGFQRPLWQRHTELDFENVKEHDHDQRADTDRFPPHELAEEIHEGDDEDG